MQNKEQIFQEALLNDPNQVWSLYLFVVSSQNSLLYNKNTARLKPPFYVDLFHVKKKIVVAGLSGEIKKIRV